MPGHFMLQDTLPGVEPRDLINVDVDVDASTSSKVSDAHNDAVAHDRPSIASLTSIAPRVDTADWPRIARELDQYGCAVLPGLLDARECGALAALYPRDDLYRSRVVMARHGFGRGEYRYFDYPLPDVVGGLRTTLYPHLVPVANRWNETMGIEVRYPATHTAFLRRCHDAGQLRPTPLILQYGKDDYNCLHQDLYGEHVFPLQAAILLSEPGVDFSGGEFVMTEQRPRMQSRVEVVPLHKGDAVIFAVHHRPVQGTRGAYRVNLRHGVSRLRSGHRHTLGVIFHDAL
ncbi:2OG-Fe(II) oxygenase [Paraburkholderia acidicola]|uniref:2OG-Fe(II) oxygenase n=1 Tax=Paraburkholderia acidicola TaxID=1912599 RepID=UPI001F3FEACA|nr:2OG-Fe(II) oxygenase [Paraburkholderia acidicola]